MRTCFLHLGMPKTGSTSIQKAFGGYDDKNLVYARLRAVNHGGDIISYFSEHPENTRVYRRMGGKRFSKRAKGGRREFEASLKGKKNVIFSGECIVRQLEPAEFANMIEFFSQRFDRVEVIAYLRPLASLVGSQMQQQIKMGQRTFQLPAPHYKRFFAPILDNVDREHLRLVRFDRRDLLGGDVLHDFAQRVGADLPPKEMEGINRSLSAEAVGAIYAFNKYTGHLLTYQERLQVLKMLHRSLEDVGDTKFGLSEDLIRSHLENHADEVAWMEKEAGFDVKGTIKTVPSPIHSEADLMRLAEEVSTMAIGRKTG